MKWRRILSNVSVCFLTSHPIPNVIFTFVPLSVVLQMYEDIKWHNVISNFKQFFDEIPILYFGLRMKLEDKCERYIINRLLNVYCESSYGGDALASSCVLRHMNSCRIFHNIHSITYIA